MDRYMIVIPSKNKAFSLRCDAPDGEGMKQETLTQMLGGPVKQVPTRLEAAWAREKNVNGFVEYMYRRGYETVRPFETLANFRQLNEWVATDGVDVAMIAQGTATELQDRGLFGCANTCHAAYKRGGVYAPAGIVRMTMEVTPRQVHHLPDQGFRHRPVSAGRR